MFSGVGDNQKRGSDDSETRTFPFVRMIASNDPVYSFFSGLFVRQLMMFAATTAA